MEKITETTSFLMSKLAEQYSQSDFDEILNGYVIKHTTFRVNTLKSNRENIIKILEQNEIKFEKCRIIL